MRIGITERGDAALDLSWSDKLDDVDGCVLITKRLSRRFCETLLERDDGRIVLHATCTGWGGTVLEPGVYGPEQTLASLVKLIGAGFPRERCVLRIDPVIPTREGLRRMADVVLAAEADPALTGMRKRISVMDEYRHVKARLRAAGIPPFYGGEAFQPDDAMRSELRLALERLHEKTGSMFETCAEPWLADLGCTRTTGCIGPEDLARMGLPLPQTGVNPQKRSGCLCMECKTELLSAKRRCPHGCLYCYWKDHTTR